MKFRVAILKENWQTTGKNFDTKKECEEFIIKSVEEEKILKAMIGNKKTGEREIIDFKKEENKDG